MSAKPPRVFISYSHDSPEHSERVLVLANALRSQGVDVELDRYQVRPSKGWPHWCEEQLRPENSDYVLVICTATYRKRVEGKVPADEGRGVFWEGGIVYGYLCDGEGNERFIPVLLDGASEDDIPRPLCGSTRYTIRAFEFTDAGYEALYRELTGEPKIIKPPLGVRVPLPKRVAEATAVLPAIGLREVVSSFPSIAPTRFPGHGGEELLRRDGNADELDKRAEAATGRLTSQDRAGGRGQPVITALEIVLDRPPERFDESEFMQALRGLIGGDVLKVRIASIRRGSTIVRLEGDNRVLGMIVAKFRDFQAVCDDFARATGMASVSWVVNGSKYELRVSPSDEQNGLGSAELAPDLKGTAIMAGTSNAKPVFISYAHKDNESSDPNKRWFDRLKEHLEPLLQQDSIAVWSDQDIDLGDDWHARIQAQLNGARAAVLLVSPAFLASRYINSSELPVLLRRAKEQGVKIIPIVLRPCMFAETNFKYPDPKKGPDTFTLASLQAAGSPSKALSEMTEGEQDRALLRVAQSLARLVGSNP